MSRVWLVASAACLCIASSAHAQTVLTLEETVARARERAASVAVARARVAESEAALLDPSARFRENPLVSGGLGPRSGDFERTTDVELSVSQLFETGGQRKARLAGATAAIDRQKADVEQTAREAVFEAASAFLDGLAAIERVSVAQDADSVSRQLLTAAERRFAAGDIAAIDVNLARIDAARSAAVLRGSRADLQAVEDRIRSILRLPANEPLELRGSLDPPPAPALEQLEAAVAQRPEFAALAADAREAEAQTQLGRALGKPDLGLSAGYSREGPDTIVLGGLTATLPLFHRGQGTLAAGLARGSRVRLEAELARERAVRDVRAAYRVYTQRAELVAALTKDALPSVADNESLAQRSYDAGEINLMDMLLIRRDAVDARTAVIERRLDAARSRLVVDFAAGVLR